MRSGDLALARADLERGLALYQAAEDDRSVVWTHRETVNRGLPVRLANVFLAHVTCWAGEPDRALNHIAVAVELCQREGFVAAVPQAKFFRLQVLSWLVEPSTLAEPIEELIGLCAALDLPYFGAAAKILKGYVIACAGDAGLGRTIITEGLAAYEATEAVTWTPYYRALLAETCLMLGRARDARDILTAALDQTDRSGERWYAAELHRRIGEAYRHLGDDLEAEAQFVTASRIARQQGARLWELNIAASHARLLRDQGQAPTARRLLSAVLRTFSEGFDTAPLSDARRLLDTL